VHACSLYCFLGCSPFGFKFEFYLLFQIQKPFLIFALLLSLFPLFSLPWAQPSRPAASLIFLSLPCARGPLPWQAQPRPLSSLLLSRARPTPSPPRPSSLPPPRPRSRLRSLPSLPLSGADRRGPPVRPFSPTAPDSSSSPAHPPRDPRRRVRLGPARPGAPRPSYKGRPKP
jgi:hypothetical protein